jgi:hypothetical protein
MPRPVRQAAVNATKNIAKEIKNNPDYYEEDDEINDPTYNPPSVDISSDEEDDDDEDEDEEL